MKTYTFTVTMDDKGLRTDRKYDGLSPVEVIGLLQLECFLTMQRTIQAEEAISEKLPASPGSPDAAPKEN